MSCGNRFQCGLKKPSRFSFQPDKPSNPELHNENQKRLNDLLKAREEIDKQFFTINTKSENSAMTIHKSEENKNITYMPLNEPINDHFTVWKTPSSEWKSK
jgi:hypothetical protein